LAGQGDGALHGDAHLFSTFRLIGGKLATAFQQVRIHLDDRENVIEIMRYAARQLADALHFLGLPVLFLQFALFGDVARNFGSAENFAGTVSER
jgi:hypothetical protein